jgi:hypothetical protein
LPLALPPFWLIAASCFAAGESRLPEAAPAPAGDDGVSAESPAMVTGLDKGEGLRVRLDASDEEPRAGMLTSLGCSCLVEGEDSLVGDGEGLVETDLLRLADEGRE